MYYNENDLLDFIKRRLGVPYNPIEISDEDILKIVIKRVIPLFSKYFPVKEIVTFTSEYYNSETRRFHIDEEKLFDKGRRFLAITNIVDRFDTGINKALHRYNNAYDFVNDRLLGSMSKEVVAYEMYRVDGSHYFSINNNISKSVTVKLETTHAVDLSTVQNNQIEVLEIIALAEVSQELLAIRSMYENLSTAVGEINLNLEMLRNNIEMYENIKDDLKKAAIFSKRTPLIIA